MEPLLEIRDLKTYFDTREGTVRAVDGVSLSIGRGDTLGVVGESGCGKTVLSLSVMRLVPVPPGRYAGGRILFEGRDLLELDEKRMRDIRGKDISMIFQEPMTALNPVLSVGDQIGEVFRVHRGMSRKEALREALEMLRLVRIPSPEERLSDYPHQLSGGMRQRVMIAMALACRPRLMLADEPTTALDVTVQAQILDLVGKLKEETGTSVLLITHDLGVVAESAEHAAIMYAGRIVEYGTVRSLYARPFHPYTAGLLASVPRMSVGGKSRLSVIPGTVPDLFDLPPGCRFRDRCPGPLRRCGEEEPELAELEEGHFVSCWREP
ncbi:MAG TPA: ABC transporter ATP-binding protein [Syntrophales bacterium]|nr:ABC transporter ATP-binding protein [Syntrophales bacterium]HQN79192.1 ABC transporter ATP-binding protein [Syntrophales bacterium]